MRRTGALSIATLLWLWTATASAAEPLDLDATAASHFELAVQAFRAQQWDAARAEFQVAYDLSHRPDLLHNLSLVAEKQARIDDALRFERQFREQAKLTEAEQAEADARIAKLQALAATPAQPAVPVSSGGTSGAVAAPAPHPDGRKRLAIAGEAVGGLFLVGALGTGIAGSLAKSDLESRPITLDELEAGKRNGVAYQAVTITLAIAGSALVAGSTVALIKLRKR